MRVFLFALLFSLPLFGQTTPQSLSFNVAPGIFNVGPTQFVTDDAGNVLVVWSVDNGQNTVLQFAYKPVLGDWQIPGDPRLSNNVISPFFYSVVDWTVAMDREGNAVVVWRIDNRSTGIVVQAIYRPLGNFSSFTDAGDPRVLDNFLNNYLYEVDALPQVGIGDGNVSILWRVFNGFNNVLQASIGSGGTFSRPGLPTIQANILNYLSFRPGVFDITNPAELIVDFDGNAIVAWQLNNQVVPTVQLDNQVVQAVIRAAGGAFEIAGNPQQQVNILSPRIYSINQIENVTINSGNASVSWERTDVRVTENLILQSAFRPLGGPWQKPELT